MRDTKTRRSLECRQRGVALAVLALAAWMAGLFGGGGSPRAMLEEAAAHGDPAWRVSLKLDRERPHWRLKAAGPTVDGALLVVAIPVAPDLAGIRATPAAERLPELGTNYGAALARYRETED